MKQTLLFLALLGGCFMGYGQKPMPVNSLTIELPPENEEWAMSGNLRMAQKTGRPAALYQVNYRVSGLTPEAMGREYLTRNSALLGLTTANIAGLRLHAVRADAAGTIIRLRQYWQGLPVTGNAEITVHITPNQVVDYVMNGFVYGIALTNTTPAITATTARQTIFNHLGLSGNIAGVQSTLQVLRNNGHDYLVHHFVIPVTQPLGEWDVFVDAHTGQLLQVKDKAAYHRHKNKPRPVSSPLFRPWSPARVTVNGTGNVFDPDPLTTATAVYGGSYVDGSDANAAVLTAQLKSVVLNDITLSAGVYSLSGPYASILDFEAPNKGLFTQATATFAFDRNADAFEAVNTYYHIDAMMRYLNVTLGLTIMPYQYTGGVRFDPSGLSGADNSYYLGASGRLSFGEGGVDDAEDADVIIHELGHGLHDWVTVGGLSQVNGLSEGTGDYIAGSYSRFKGYWPVSTGNNGYNWTFNWDGHNTFWAGRLLNYSAVYPTGLTGSIHTDGQIWATANMKIWDDIGRQKADRVFWSGLAMTNAATNQNDAANAVYQAASALGYTNAERLAIHTRYTAAGYILPTFVLPVVWASFAVDKNGDDALVQFTTATETGTRSFTIERSTDGSRFTEVTTLPAAGVGYRYAYTDANAAALQTKLYYRVKQTDANGAVTYTRIASVQFGKRNVLHLFPNPAQDVVTIRTQFTNGNISISNAAGKTVYTQKLSNVAGGQVTISLRGLPQGTYQVKLVAVDGTVQQAQLVKAK